MKFSYSWFTSYYKNAPDPQTVAEVLTKGGLETVVLDTGRIFGKLFVVGKVEAVEKHPHADRLHVCTVRVNKKDVRTIVCGAPNVAQGQTVAVVLPGGTLPSGDIIKEAEIRGVRSSGMICAADELGIGSSHEGILELDATRAAGTLLDACDLSDTILETEVTANRPDWLSLEGTAREYAALANKKMIVQNAPLHETGVAVSRQYNVVVSKGCASVYLLRLLTHMEVAPTPADMTKRLLASGVEPIHLAVDVTNYVLLERGQPLHAFDAAKISGKTIRVRKAKDKESITLLDGETYALTSEDIVIADNKGPIALAGVMGGLRTAVSKETTEVLLEAASFPASAIRKTSKRLGLLTDAANRFERNVCEQNVPDALARAASLLEQYAHARVARGVVGQKPKIQRAQHISCSVRRMNALLGTTLTGGQMKQYLLRLGFQIKLTRDTLHATPPEFRTDISLEADVAEEVGRLYGFHSLRPELPRVQQQVPVVDPLVSCAADFRKASLSFGYTEVSLPSFYGIDAVGRGTVPTDAYLELQNPTDSRAPYLRSDLLPLMLEAVERNRKRFASVKLMEIGQVFWKQMKPGTHEWRITWAVSLQGGGALVELQQHVLSLVERVLHRKAHTVSFGNGKQFMDIKIDATPVGYMALKPMKKGMTVAVCECSLSELLACKQKEAYVTTSEFPYVRRDVAVVVPAQMDVPTLMRQIYRASSCVTRVELFDSHPQSQSSVSYAFHVHLQSRDKTLSAKEVELEMTTIERALQQKGGMVRS